MKALLVIAMSLLMTGIVPTAFAADTKASAKKGEETKAKSDTLPLYGKVVAITARTLTIVRSDNPEATQTKFGIVAATEIVNNDKPATIDDVKVGRWIGGSYKKSGGDTNDTVLRINVGAKQKEPGGKGESKAPKKGESKATKKKGE